ncbi:MAG: exodeoxyribonuclease VII large subunit [Candidatus Makaraimicrobium thalassicum]|nr:MAG: exodeoxyribonuclease VII large subunit [Candidatus Omnitrophota bacterium]
MNDVNVYTVTRLTRDIRLVLEDTFQAVWVEGEVSNFTVSSAGHTYFSLKDESSLLNCVMFRGNSGRVGFTVKDGMQVLCYGRVSVYDKRGQYQLYATKMEPRGKGALQLAFEQLKEKLYKEGLFDEANKKPLPFLPMHLGVITSATGAAVRDILKVARRRFTNIKISIYPVRVQGDEAKHEIARAIEELNEYNRHIAETGGEYPVDVIIVGRGGGSLEDLWPFNEEIVAREIYASEIPVVSAVGHEIDYTISDFVADLRAPTPSAAAELVIPLKHDLTVRINEYRDRLYLSIKTKTEMLEKAVKTSRDRYVLRAPMNVFLQMRQQVDDLLRTAVSGISHSLELKQRDLGTVTGKLQALSPLAVLERGYSITFKDGRIVRDAGLLEEGDILHSRLSLGRVTSRVEHVG